MLWAALYSGPALAADPTVEETYPGLAFGVLKHARLAQLEEGVVLSAEGVRITIADLDQALEGHLPAMREQLRKNLFFLLEQEATQRLLFRAAGGSGDVETAPNQVIMSYLDEQIKDIDVTNEAVRRFYDENRDSFGGAAFNDVMGSIHNYLLEEKKRRAVRTLIEKLGERMEVRLDADWVKRQSEIEGDNPVGRARSSGKPSLVEFGAAGCSACDMMRPVLETLRKAYGDRVNVVSVNLALEAVLGSRYGISMIPVQVFFDAEGREIFRHTGFYPQDEIEKRLAEMGVPK
jgi:thiol-disulfide isomerase/thioredoxin